MPPINVTSFASAGCLPCEPCVPPRNPSNNPGGPNLPPVPQPCQQLRVDIDMTQIPIVVPNGEEQINLPYFTGPNSEGYTRIQLQLNGQNSGQQNLPLSSIKSMLFNWRPQFGIGTNMPAIPTDYSLGARFMRSLLIYNNDTGQLVPIGLNNYAPTMSPIISGSSDEGTYIDAELNIMGAVPFPSRSAPLLDFFMQTYSGEPGGQTTGVGKGTFTFLDCEVAPFYQTIWNNIAVGPLPPA